MICKIIKNGETIGDAVFFNPDYIVYHLYASIRITSTATADFIKKKRWQLVDKTTNNRVL